MLNDFTYIGIIAVLVSMIAGLLFSAQPHDCSQQATNARMAGYVEGMRSTTDLFRDGE